MVDSRLERSLSLLRDQGLRAIREGSKGSLERIFNSHADFISFYLDARSRFTVKLAARDVSLSGLAGYESRTAYLILQSLDELIKATFRSNDPDLIDVAIRALLLTEILLLERNADSLYRVFLARIQTALILVLGIDDVKVRRRILSRILVGQNELIQYRVIFDLLQRPKVDVDSLISFSKELIRTLSLPMKMALEAKKVDEFKVIVHSLNQTFDPGHLEPSSKLMEVQAKIAYGEAMGSDASALQESKAKLEKQVKFLAAVGSYRRLVLFGLGGWATHLFDSGKQSERDFSLVFDTVLPTMLDLENLASVYLLASAPDSDAEFGWWSWGMDSDESAHGAHAMWQWTNEDSWLSKYYVLVGVRLPSDAPSVEHLIPTVNKLLFSAQMLEQFGQTIRKLGDEYMRAPQKWGVVIPEIQQLQLESGASMETFTEKLNRVALLWDQLGARVRADEEGAILRAEVTGVEEFSKKFREAWFKAAALRARFKELDGYEDFTDQESIPVGVPRFGINILEQKQWFVRGSESAASSIAEHLGENMAQLETEAVYERILSALVPVRVEGDEELLRRLEEFVASLDVEVLKRYTIVTDFRDKLGAEFYKSRLFEYPGDRTRQFQYWGYFKGIPILTLWRKGGNVPSPSLICADLCRLGRLRQFRGDGVGHDLSISIRAIDEHNARELLRANPQLVLRYGARLATSEERLFELQKRVHIQISQRFEFEIAEHGIGIRFDPGVNAEEL